MTVRVDRIGAAQILRQHKEVTLLCHVHPDADAIGSVSGLSRALRASGATVYSSFDPGDVPHDLHCIPGSESFLPLEQVPIHKGLVVVLDCADAARTGEGQLLFKQASEVLVIDHHISNPGFGTAILLDSDAASTASLVTEILLAGGFTIDAETASALYAGLLTDTGSFRWGGAGAHDTAGTLLALGAQELAPTLAYELLDAHSFSWLSLLGELLSTVRLDRTALAGRAVVWLMVGNEIIGQARMSDIESLTEHLRGVREASVSVLAKEYQPQVWSVSFRSSDGTDVRAIASRLGGGGHLAAAGCTISGTSVQVEQQVREALLCVGGGECNLQ